MSEKPTGTEAGEKTAPSVMEETKTRNLEWRCTGCGKTALPTESGYASLLPHKCTGEKHIWLIDKDTGDQLANNSNQAVHLGLIERGAGKPKGEGKKGEIEVSSDGILTLTISLPADAFTLFNMAKAAGKEKDVDKSFDVWVWDCIRKRFEKDYKLQVVLAGIEEE